MGAGYVEELIKVKILPDIDRYFQIMASMGSQDKVETLLLLIQNVDVFAWTPYEVLGVDPEFIVHKLNIDPSFLPKTQKPRRSAREHVEVVRLEGNLFPEMVGKYRSSKEEERQVKGMCRFHGFEPSVPKRSIPYTED